MQADINKLRELLAEVPDFFEEPRTATEWFKELSAALPSVMCHAIAAEMLAAAGFVSHEKLNQALEIAAAISGAVTAGEANG